MGWLSILSFGGCGKKSQPAVREVGHGPFTIHCKTVSRREFSMNYGRMGTHVRTDYAILYKAAPVVFPAALQTNTGYSNLWKVYILAEAPRPALIAGSQSMYLITEEGGKAKLTVLDEQSSGFAGVQWLDSEDGQPARMQEVYMSEDTDSSLVLTGGNYLLISSRTVLRISDLSIHSLHNRNWIDGYSILAPNGAVGFSPDQQQVAFPGSRNDQTDHLKYHYALLVFDHTTAGSYLVPFDQTDTRMRDVHTIDRTWLETFFEWRQEENGAYRLQLRDLERLPYWQGWFSDQDTYYHVQPVGAEMLPVFAGFVRDLWDLPEEALASETVVEFQYIHIRYGEMKFSVGYRAVAKDLHFSKYLFEPESEEYQALVVQIGKAFNEALAKGEYQEFFTSY